MASTKVRTPRRLTVRSRRTSIIRTLRPSSNGIAFVTIPSGTIRRTCLSRGDKDATRLAACRAPGLSSVR